MQHPLIIQGGMGMGISNWCLANAVSRLGHLGVVSGTAIDNIFVRRLQNGDPGNHISRAMQHFPFPEIAKKMYEKYFVAGGIAAGQSFKRVPIYSVKPNINVLQLTVLANFTEIFLAKENHNGKIGINLLEKIQLPNLASLYGAMLAGVDYVIMGAGIPREIPRILDTFANHEEASLKISVENADKPFEMKFDPQSIMGKLSDSLKRPFFLPIISSLGLGKYLKKKSLGEFNGFIIEESVAGGHNAPPRDYQLNARGEPIYGIKDIIDVAGIKELGYPFWLAGAYGNAERLNEALELGATGVQVGTPFALCNESGLDPELKKSIIETIISGKGDVFTDPKASPTGFPFKVFQMEGTNSDAAIYEKRPRVCDLGYLRTSYMTDEGKIISRCPAEPVDQYVKNGGKIEDTVDRKCLCNGLLANIGIAQTQKHGYVEKPLMTIGECFEIVKNFVIDGKTSYSAADVIQYILTKKDEPVMANQTV